MIGNFLFLVEGKNEKAFYEKLLSALEEKNPLLKEISRQFISVGGCTRFETKAYGLAKDYCSKNPTHKTAVFLCYDTDVFEKKHYDRSSIGKTVEKIKTISNVRCVLNIEACPSLERFLLEDPSALREYLKLSIDQCMVDPNRGLGGIKEIFRKANRYYVKNLEAINQLISLLDFEGFQSRHRNIIELILTAADDLKAVTSE